MVEFWAFPIKFLSVRTAAGRDKKNTAALCNDAHGTTHFKMSPLEFMQRLLAFHQG